MAEMQDGYPFVFLMNGREYSDNQLEYVLQYRFKSNKSHKTYIVRVERYVDLLSFCTFHHFRSPFRALPYSRLVVVHLGE